MADEQRVWRCIGCGIEYEPQEGKPDLRKVARGLGEGEFQTINPRTKGCQVATYRPERKKK